MKFWLCIFYFYVPPLFYNLTSSTKCVFSRTTLVTYDLLLYTTSHFIARTSASRCLQKFKDSSLEASCVARSTFCESQLFDMEQTFCGFLVMEQDVVKPNLLVACLCNRIETFYAFHPTYQDTHV